MDRIEHDRSGIGSAAESGVKIILRDEPSLEGAHQTWRLTSQIPVGGKNSRCIHFRENAVEEIARIAAFNTGFERSAEGRVKGASHDDTIVSRIVEYGDQPGSRQHWFGYQKSPVFGLPVESEDSPIGGAYFFFHFPPKLFKSVSEGNIVFQDDDRVPCVRFRHVESGEESVGEA